MKKKQIILISFVVFIIIAAIILCVWYYIPKTFLNRLDASEVMTISVFDGNTGKGFVIESSEEIRQIVENIQQIKMKRDSISVGYSGYSFRVQFMDQNGKVIDSFIINSSNSIRDDPFFYRCDGGLCYDYMKDLEDMYTK